jgi:ankyrin repeat protein
MLQKALAGLPPDLDQTYERILGTIDGDYSPYALRILQWVAFSIRPLFIDEVAEVVAIDPKRDPAFDCDEVLEDPLEVLNICSSLVTMVVDQGSPRQVVELAHYSVKEYLVSDRICTGKAAMYSMREDTSHDSIAASCLGYLLQLPEPSLGLKFLRPCGLAGYSTPYWPSHVEKAGERSKGTTEAIIRLLDEKEVAYINWVILYEHRQPGPDHKDIPEPLYYAASFGLIDVVKLLLDKGANVNAQKGIDNNGSALYAASYRGHEATVKLLLDKGAMPPANCEDIYEPLHAASQNGHEAVVKLLLNKFADIYTTGECYSESLLEASFQGHEAIVKLLLDKGAVTGECYSKALYAASLEGSEATVKVLLDKSAIFPKRADCYGEALWVASYGGHEAVVKLLLDMCDIVPGTARYYDTALDTAANKHHEAVVKLLLDKGAVMPNACS